MEEELDDDGAVPMQVMFEVDDRLETILPEPAVASVRGQALSSQDFRMDADDQHLLVIRSVEDADPPPLGEERDLPPEEVVSEFGRARMLEAEDIHALRIHARHDVADRAVLSGCVHSLKDHEQRVGVGRSSSFSDSAFRTAKRRESIFMRDSCAI